MTENKLRFVEQFLLCKTIDKDFMLKKLNIKLVDDYLKRRTKYVLDRYNHIEWFYEQLVLLEDGLFQKSYVRKIADKTHELERKVKKITDNRSKLEVLFNEKLDRINLQKIVDFFNDTTKTYIEFTQILKEWLKHIVKIFGEVQKKLIRNHIERIQEEEPELENIPHPDIYKAHFNDECQTLYQNNSTYFSQAIETLFNHIPLVFNKESTLDGGRFYFIGLFHKYMRKLDSSFLDYDYTSIITHKASSSKP